MNRPLLRQAALTASPRGLLALLAFCLCVIALAACSSLSSTRASSARPVPRAPGPLPAVATPSELRLDLDAGTYVRLVISPVSEDVVIRQVAPDGAPIETLELPPSGDLPTRLSWLITGSGQYRWTVEPRARQAPSSRICALAVEELRPAGPCDSSHLRAERNLLAARLQLAHPGSDPGKVRTLLDPAMADAIEVGEQQDVLAVMLETARLASRVGAGNAEGLFERSLELARASGNRFSETKALEGLAPLLPAARQLDAMSAALAAGQQLGDESGQADILVWLGRYFGLQGDTAAEIRHYQQALALHARNGDVRGQAWTLCELGLVFERQGDLDRARGYLDLGLDRAEAAGDLETQAAALRNRARLDIDLGELQAAYDEYSRAHKLVAAAPAGPEAVEAAWALDGLARTLLYLGEPQPARQRYGEALTAFQALQHPEGVAYALLGIGSAAEADRDPAAALGTFLEALAIIRANGLRWMEALALYDLGKVHRELGQPVQAIVELEQALALEPAGSAVRQAQTEVELARAYSQNLQSTRAEGAFQHAVQLSRRAPLIEAAAQAGLARIERDHRDLTAARAAIERAIQLTENLRASVIRPDQRVSLLASRRAYFEFYVDLLMRMDQLEPGAGNDRQAVAASEQARARGLLDLLAKERVDVRQGIPPELKQREAAIGEHIAHLQTRIWSSANLALPELELRRLERELIEAQEEEKDLGTEISRREPAYAAVRASRPLALGEIQQLLDDRTALLEYFVGEESSYLFVVTHDGLTTHPLPPKQDLSPLVGRLRSAVLHDNRLQARQFAVDAHALYRWLIQPAAGELRDKPHLIIAADGLLHSLSFDVLLTDSASSAPARRQLPYLIRERSVSYVPSASVLAQLLGERRVDRAPRGAGKLFVGFGDPGYAPAGVGEAGRAPAMTRCAPAAAPGIDGDRTRASDRLRPLPAARQEVCRIADLFPLDRAVVFLGPEAAEENVKTSAIVAAARNLHFASHGLLDEDQPDLSGLRLTHLEGSAEDGLLQVREIFNLELHADLVVLSACQTGLGKEVSGEGLIGMTRAFLYAGAASIVVSLWQVDDESTSDLMVSFYRHLQEIGDKAESLRQAKLELMDRGPYSHPYYWAPFILVGRPQ